MRFVFSSHCLAKDSTMHLFYMLPGHGFKPHISYSEESPEQ